MRGVPALVATLAHHFEEGGWGMYPIVLCGIVLLAIALERAWVFTRPRDGGEELVERLAWALRAGDVRRALAIAIEADGPAAKIARAALSWSDPMSTFESAIDALVAEELGPHRRRVPVLQGLAAIATLCGLLGTVTGLYGGFGTCNADAASRATMLARGISEAMNCTAFGLFVSLVAIGVSAVVRGGASEVEAELRATGQSLRNVFADTRAHLRWERAPVTGGSYREPA